MLYAGQSGALDVDAVSLRCGAGSDCGGCRPSIAMLFSEACRVTILGAGDEVVATTGVDVCSAT
ncbi:MAG: (2Fe-2S)-binding protein [Actinobacteria bacterium]|nr:(2Fe-2S)-binding protein [Actinomycetota bacterium]